MRDLLRLDESLDGFEKDGEAEGDEEDAVDESTQCLCALPLPVVSAYPWDDPAVHLLHMCMSLSSSFDSRP